MRRPTPVSPLEEADAQFERRATVKAAHALKQDLEDMQVRFRRPLVDAREAKAATDYLKGDMELRRREYQETQRSCQTLELALEALRREVREQAGLVRAPRRGTGRGGGLAAARRRGRRAVAI